MLIAQITDLHIVAPGTLAYGKVDTAAFLERAIAKLVAFRPRPDVVLITGDLVDLGTAEEYVRVRALLAPLDLPYLIIPGNHDVRDLMHAAFDDLSDVPKSGHFCYAVDRWPVRLIALDTLIEGRPDGELCESRRAWLADALAAGGDKPTMIFMHHPPFLTGIDHMDRMGLADREAFAAIIARHPNVERIVCGHLHRSIEARFAGTIAATLPSTAHQVGLDLVPNAPPSFTYEPPMIGMYLWRPGLGFVAHFLPIGDYPPS